MHGTKLMLYGQKSHEESESGTYGRRHENQNHENLFWRKTPGFTGKLICMRVCDTHQCD